MNTLGLIQDDSWQIGFVLDAVMYDAITLDELKQWAAYILEEHKDDSPDYISEILLIDNKSQLMTIVMRQFPPYSPVKDSIIFGLSGIGYKRNLDVQLDDNAPNKEVCLSLLEQHHSLEETYRKVFPFIEW